MSSRTCPDWPRLMEIAPDLQFKHYTVLEAKVPGEALMKVPGLDVSSAEICCDLDHHVFWAEHTDPSLVEPLRATHWYELSDWPGSA